MDPNRNAGLHNLISSTLLIPKLVVFLVNFTMSKTKWPILLMKNISFWTSAYKKVLLNKSLQKS